MNKFISTNPITEPCGTPLVRWTGCPSGDTAEAVSHRLMYSKHQGSFTCFAIAFLNRSQSSSSNARRMSNSTTQSYSQHRLRVADFSAVARHRSYNCSFRHPAEDRYQRKSYNLDYHELAEFDSNHPRRAQREADASRNPYHPGGYPRVSRRWAERRSNPQRFPEPHARACSRRLGLCGRAGATKHITPRFGQNCCKSVSAPPKFGPVPDRTASSWRR